MAITTGRYLSRTALNSVGIALQGLARFFYTWAIGRFVGPKELGDISALLSISVAAALCWPAGLAMASGKLLSLPGTADRARSFLRKSFLLAELIITPAAAIAAFSLSREPHSVLASAALVLSYGGYTFTRGVLIGQDRLRMTAAVDALSAILTVSLTIAAVFGPKGWSLAYPLTVGYILFTLLAWPRKSDEEPLAGEETAWGSFTRSATLAALASGGLLPATMLFVRAHDLPAAGYFAAALSLATPVNMLAQAVNQVLIPQFSHLYDSDLQHELGRRSSNVFWTTSLAFVAIFGVLIAITPVLLNWIFGQEYLPGVGAMRSLLAIVGVISCNAAPSALLLATGRQKAFARTWLISFIAGLLVMMLLSPSYGQWGAMAGYAIGAAGGSLAIIAMGIHQTQKLRLVPALNHT